jgi:hypothetical protein
LDKTTIKIEIEKYIIEKSRNKLKNNKKITNKKKTYFDVKENFRTTSVFSNCKDIFFLVILSIFKKNFSKPTGFRLLNYKSY